MKKQQEQRSPLIPVGAKLYESSGLTFGKYLKMSRELQKLTQEDAAKKLGISTEYFVELETDKRFAPTGELYRAILKNFDYMIFEGGFDADGHPLCSPLDGSEWAGSMRDEVPAEMEEFLRRNWFGRYMVHALMYIEPDVLRDEELIEKMQDLMLKHAESRHIDIPEMPMPEYEDTGYVNVTASDEDEE